MDLFFNATASSLELPTPGRNGTRIVGVGESFYGNAFYEKFVQQGILARISFGMALHKVYVDSADVAATAAGSSTTPYRYKKASVSNTSEGQIKFIMAYSVDAGSNDPMLITYYFYTDYNNPTKPTHTLSRTGIIGNDWQFPDWAQLPDNFYDMDPLSQRDALLARQ